MVTSSLTNYLLRLRQTRVSAPARYYFSTSAGGPAKFVSGARLVVAGVLGYNVCNILLGSKSVPDLSEVDKNQRTIAIRQFLIAEEVDEKSTVESSLVENVEQVLKPEVKTLKSLILCQYYPALSLDSLYSLKFFLFV